MAYHKVVLGPLLSTPFTSLISSLSLNHHLYADDNQLFVSFQPTSCTENICRLQAALGSIAEWMTSDLLCLNSAKTKFYLLGLKPQLNKIHNLILLSDGHSVPPTASACNLGFIFDSQSSFLLRSHFFCLSCMFPFDVYAYTSDMCLNKVCLLTY